MLLRSEGDGDSCWDHAPGEGGREDGGGVGEGDGVRQLSHGVRPGGGLS